MDVEERMSEEVLERLEAHSKYFSSMLAMIPAKYLHEQDEGEQFKGKYFHNKRERKPKQTIKEASKRAKRLKLDPEPGAGIVEEDAGKNIHPEVPSSILQGFSVEHSHNESPGDLKEKLRAKIASLQTRREGVQSSGKNKKAALTSKQDRKKKQKSKTITVASAPAKKPAVVREDGKVVFSKFDFTVPSEPSDKVDKTNKVDYKKLLAKAEAKEQSLKALKEKDAKRSEELEEQINWSRAVSKARGDKIKDDPVLLKKTIKRKEQQKRSSQKKWKARKSQEQKRIELKQETRQRHIKERIDAKKVKKMGKKMKGKGKTRNPGF